MTTSDKDHERICVSRVAEFASNVEIFLFECSSLVVIKLLLKLLLNDVTFAVKVE